MRENLTHLRTKDTRFYTRSYEILYQILYQILRDHLQRRAIETIQRNMLENYSEDRCSSVHASARKERRSWSPTNRYQSQVRERD